MVDGLEAKKSQAKAFTPNMFFSGVVIVLVGTEVVVLPPVSVPVFVPVVSDVVLDDLSDSSGASFLQLLKSVTVIVNNNTNLLKRRFRVIV